MQINKLKFLTLKKQNYFRSSLLVVFAILFIGCASSKKVNYFQDEKGQSEGFELSDTIVNYEPTIQYGDMLSINVSAMEPELAVPFNIVETRENQLIRQIPYIVNVSGEINFPVLGEIKVAQLTTQQVTDLIYQLLLKYLNEPTVTVQLVNFKVSVLGEVTSPGSYNISNERINILEALALAGDLTIYGKRKTVTLIREYNGMRKFVPIDLTNKELFNSPYYFLAQNDIIYVESNKTRVNSSKVGPNTAIIVSSLSILISLVAILAR